MKFLAHSLSPPAAALHDAKPLTRNRPWIRHEGWLLKETRRAIHITHPRYFAVDQTTMHYFKEENIKLSCPPHAASAMQKLGFELDDSGVVVRLQPGGLAAQQKALVEGDVIIGFNGQPAAPAQIYAMYAAMHAEAGGAALTLIFTLLRPKAKLALGGATVAPCGVRKHGGFSFTVAPFDAGSSNSKALKYSLVAPGEKACGVWLAALHEAAAAAAMGSIKQSIAEGVDIALSSAMSGDGGGGMASEARFHVLASSPRLPLLEKECETDHFS